MASDTPDFDRRKHHHSLSEDEESKKFSKCHKHRHHKHCHHRHRSKKHEDEAKDGGEDPLPQPPLPSVLRLDDDVEEREILDEELTQGFMSFQIGKVSNLILFFLISIASSSGFDKKKLNPFPWIHDLLDLVSI